MIFEYCDEWGGPSSSVGRETGEWSQVWIFQPYNNPYTNLKNNTKIGHCAQNQASAMAIPVLWPEPCRKWVGWTEEKKHQHGAGNLKGLERFWIKEWSLISSGVL